ncbi:Uncharacterised protein [Klebsiella pneumoniae]|nr:Uncharacterised protein [Klebsiella pneumoniae]
MITILHFPNGSQSITKTFTGGYEPNRTDKLLYAHIALQSGYDLYISHSTISIRYKNIYLEYGKRYHVGKNTYAYHSIHHYSGKESKTILTLHRLIEEAIEWHTLHGEPITPYRITSILNQYRDAA